MNTEQHRPLRPARALPDLTRTAAALALYDMIGDEIDRARDITDDMIDHYESARRRVAVAYGLDTADRNNPADCAASLADPTGLRFVRRMVAQWRGER